MGPELVAQLVDGGRSGLRVAEVRADRSGEATCCLNQLHRCGTLIGRASDQTHRGAGTG
ncbi:MAG: hypothetical protein WBR33_12300 [Pseudonocardiaceae bacterium]